MIQCFLLPTLVSYYGFQFVIQDFSPLDSFDFTSEADVMMTRDIVAHRQVNKHRPALQYSTPPWQAILGQQR